MITCQNCSEKNAPGTLFCRRCGQRMLRSGYPWNWIAVAAMVVSVVVIVLVARRTGVDPAAPPPPAPVAAGPTPVRVGIAYGTEKQRWMEWAAAEFSKTDAGRGVTIDLKPMGSLEAAQAIVRGDASIQVWSPASSLYQSVFLRDWAVAHKEPPILKQSSLALTPMVFVTWRVRHEAFLTRYPELSFTTIADAMALPGGWKEIADKPDWMFFKFSHTNPPQSNSGLMALVLMAYDVRGKNRGLGGAEITSAAFRERFDRVERGLVGASSGLVPSTGTLMTAMVQRGWSTYDVVMVYESNAIERLQEANGRWGELQVVYPKYNMWNDNPYEILNVPWSTPAQREAAERFLAFLLSEPAQREALKHGFRPANTSVPTNAADGPFARFASAGLRADVPGAFCEPPDAEVMENLLLAWQRASGAK